MFLNTWPECVPKIWPKYVPRIWHKCVPKIKPKCVLEIWLKYVPKKIRPKCVPWNNLGKKSLEHPKINLWHVLIMKLGGNLGKS